MNAANFPSRWITVGLAFLLLLVNAGLTIWILRSLQPITSIIVISGLLTFLLDYPVSWFEQRNLRRSWAIFIVLVLALLIVGAISFTLAPIIVQQFNEFTNRLPLWIDRANQQAQQFDKTSIFQNLPIDVSDLTLNLTNQAKRLLQRLPQQIFQVTINTLNKAVNVLLTAVLTIFLVFNGKPLWKGLLSWLPASWQVPILLSQSFQSYFSGQATIAVFQSTVLMTAFLILQVPFGLLFGLMIGLASFIPLGGALAVTIISLLLSTQDIWLAAKVLGTTLILGQITENIIAPRLIGGMLGLNPAVVFISLLTGAKVGGLLGLVLAVPVASFIKRLADQLRAANSINSESENELENDVTVAIAKTKPTY